MVREEHKSKEDALRRDADTAAAGTRKSGSWSPDPGSRSGSFWGWRVIWGFRADGFVSAKQGGG